VKRPLEDLLVVDLTRALAGPHATMMLGDLGARVVKVEVPGRGDDARGWGPPFRWRSEDGIGMSAEPTPASERESTYFLSANRNKESVVLDFNSDDDRDVFHRLVERADILVENFRTGVLDRLGLGFERLHAMNPRLIILSITGFGHDGPEGGRPGYDQIAQGEAGLMSITGPSPHEPQKMGTPISDLLAGMYGAFGLLAALHERDRTGRGQVVRTSLLAASVGVHAFQGTRWTVAREVGAAQGNHHPSISPYGLFRCTDGSVQIAVGSESLWHDFCIGFDLDPATAGLATNGERVRSPERVVAMVEAAFANWRAEDLIQNLKRIGIPAGIVRSIDQVYEWEQTLSQGLVIDVDHETLGRLQLPGPPLRFFDTEGDETTPTSHKAPPVLGADNAAILAWLNNAI
jgi:crotonobetainyl-CoA:carnitine CoA-transferase CaiB-like acyl-CoA transferase